MRSWAWTVEKLNLPKTITPDRYKSFMWGACTRAGGGRAMPGQTPPARRRGAPRAASAREPRRAASPVLIANATPKSLPRLVQHSNHPAAPPKRLLPRQSEQTTSATRTSGTALAT
jgi:hypothetical protein